MKIIDSDRYFEEKIIQLPNDAGSKVIVVGAASGRKAKKQQKQQEQIQSSVPTTSTPTEADNNRRSKAFATILALIGEGELEGFFTGDPLKDVYLDETPIKNPDGSLNFKDVILEYRSGTQDQPYIPGMADSVTRDIDVSVQLKQSSGAVVRAITDPAIDAVLIRLYTPSLTFQKEDGSIIGSDFSFKIELSSAGGGYQIIHNITFTGKTTSPYQLPPFKINLTGQPPWNIRVTRTSADSDTVRRQNDLYWQSYQEIIETKFRYPNSALLGITINAESFQSIPKLSVKLKGLKIKVPHNYDPASRTYTGIFDGTLVKRYSNNPAWILYDLLTNDRYGCGKYIDVSQVDIWSLYSIGQYCDQMVFDGKGGQEPRFVCNAYIQQKEDAYKVLEAISSCFRGMFYEAGNSIFTIQDKPKQPIRAYNQSNVVHEYDENGKLTSPPFNYSGTSLDARHTVALVSWSDPNDFYRSKVEVVRFNDAVLRYGYNPIEIVAFGCTSRGQAQRLGRWTILSDFYLTQTITFKVGAEGLLVSPGEVFKVVDTLKSGNRLGGRIKEASLTQITLDAPVTLVPGGGYVLTIVKSDGTTEQRGILNGAGTHATLIPLAGFTEVPKHIWVLESINLKGQLFQCLSVTEVAEQEHLYEITGIEYNDSIYNAVDFETQIVEIPINGLSSPFSLPTPPGFLTAEEGLYVSGNTGGSSGFKVKVFLSWQASSFSFTRDYQVEYKKEGDLSYKLAEITSDLSCTIYDLSLGTYYFRIKAISYYGRSSEYAGIVTEIFGLAAPPKNVVNFAASVNQKDIELTWNLVNDLDVLNGGYYLIKYNLNIDAQINNATWQNSMEFVKVGGSTNYYKAKGKDGAYLIKAVDSGGRESSQPSGFIVKYIFALANQDRVYLDISDREVVANNTFSQFPGNKSNVVFESYPNINYANGNITSLEGLLGLVLTGKTFDSIEGSFDEKEGYFDKGSITSAVQTGTYNLVDKCTSRESGTNEGIYSLPKPCGFQITPKIERNFLSLNYKFDSQMINFDSMLGTFDTPIFDTFGDAYMEIATSIDGTSFSSYSKINDGSYYAKSFKLRLVMQNNGFNTNVYIKNVGATVRLEERLITGTITTSASQDVVIQFLPSFVILQNPDVAVTILDRVSNESVVFSSINLNSISFSAYANGGRVVRQILYVVKGYGKVV